MSSDSSVFSVSFVIFLFTLLGLLPQALAAQDPPPDAEWRTFDTEHFRVTFQPDLEPVAVRAARAAERAHALLSDELAEPPDGTIDLVVTDHVDYSNGYATPFTSNRIVIYARPPVGNPALAYTRDWVDLVVLHELVHVFQLDIAGPLGRAVRAVFGRVPSFWPLFPAVGMPAWATEGLATWLESRFTGAGRAYGSYQEMVVRTAALEDRIPEDLEEVAGPSPVWPSGQRSYLYGAALMHWIQRQQGDDAHRRILDATAGAILPPFLFPGEVAEDALGRSFGDFYGGWREAAMDSARATAARVRAAGVTESRTVVGRGPYAIAPRVSPDGQRLAYGAWDFRSRPATRLVDLETGRVRELVEQNQLGATLGPASWLPDGSGMIVAQLDYQGPYRLFSDLWRVGPDGDEHRLTDGARLAEPDVAPDGRRVVAVQSHDGASRLVVHDLVTGRTRVLVDAAPGEAFHGPRWSPDGRRVAVSRFAGGQLDLMVVNVGTGDIARLTRDAALDRDPTWTPDGEWILFSSDRTGIPNLFALTPPPAGHEDRAPRGPPHTRQVTNVLTGAFDPEVSPDGATIYFSAYHHDGWHVERMPLDRDAWRPAPPGIMEYHAAPLADAGAEPGSPVTDAIQRAADEAEPYSAWPTVRPYFWVPTWEASIGGDGGDPMWLGLYTAGWDVLDRHSWELRPAVEVRTGRVEGTAAWTWRGLGNPVLTLSGGRDWDRGGRITLPDTSHTVLAREDRVALDARLLRQRWRSAVWLDLGAEAEWLAYEPYRLSQAQLDELDVTLPELRETVGLTLRPGFSTASLYPFSISYEDGLSASTGIGRWWDPDDGALAYDQAYGSLAGYLSFPLWGFANHVLAARGSGLLREGPQAPATTIGGSGGVNPLGLLIGTAGSSTPFLPVRGFDDGVRAGTRAWSASAEYRFPIHMPGAPVPSAAPGILGFSITSVYGALFADAGNAWCPGGAADRLDSCTTGDPLVSVGAELGVDLGLIQGALLPLRVGAAVPLQGPGANTIVLHAGLGPSF